MTATVRPQTRAVRLTDPDQRLHQYLRALSGVPGPNFSAITIVENSGYDFAADVRRLFPALPTEFICYQETRDSLPIAQLEAGMYTAFLRRSTLLDSRRSILKLTGRYTIRNIEQYINGPSNIGISFRPTFGGQSDALLTSLYKVSLNDFQGFEAILKTTNFSNEPLEVHFARYVRSLGPRAAVIQYPHIQGVSGTFATDYEKNRKERARIILSRLIPF